LKIVALGAWGVPDLYNSLAMIQDAGIEIAAVICARLKEDLVQITAERAGEHFTPKAIDDLTGPAVPFYFVDRHGDARCLALLADLAPDLLLNLGTPSILKADILGLPSIGVLNCHPGLLPHYRGCTCVEWAIFNGDPVAATCHFMTEGIDEGPIICAEIMPVASRTPYAKIRADMVGHQCRTMIKGIQRIAAENITFDDLVPQVEGTYYGVIPDEHMGEVKAKTQRGDYSSRKVV
jgi:methionyl-tRNA formyltransferase